MEAISHIDLSQFEKPSITKSESSKIISKAKTHLKDTCKFSRNF